MCVRILIATLFVVAGLSVPQSARAQDRPAAAVDTVQVVEVHLKDGSRIVGTIVSETATELVVRTTGGAMVTVPTDQVESRRVVTGQIRGGRLVTPDPNGSRLFFTSTGRPVG